MINLNIVIQLNDYYNGLSLSLLTKIPTFYLCLLLWLTITKIYLYIQLTRKLPVKSTKLEYS